MFPWQRSRKGFILSAYCAIQWRDLPIESTSLFICSSRSKAVIYVFESPSTCNATPIPILTSFTLVITDIMTTPSTCSSQDMLVGTYRSSPKLNSCLMVNFDLFLWLTCAPISIWIVVTTFFLTQVNCWCTHSLPFLINSSSTTFCSNN